MASDEGDDGRSRVHRAINDLLDDGEIAVGWCLVIDVAGPDDCRYLAHRAGGGVDGHSSPMIWTALGMLRSSVLAAEEMTTDWTVDPDEGDS